MAGWFGFDSERTKTLRRAALLHDIGKLGVSTGILEKPGKLDQAEFERVKLHPRFSYEILKEVPGFQRIADLASAHHERLDGKGYWQGLAAPDLDLDMRILTVADVFDALTAERPYRPALPLGEVFAIMDKDAETAFDPGCLEAIKATQGELQKAA
jgi:HD-GYP domain-containing protein (c-di-GMP phosphodiesterase class II)